MAKEMYHFVFRESKRLLKNFLVLFIFPLALVYSLMFILNQNRFWKFMSNNLLFFIVGFPSFVFALSFLLTWVQKIKGEDIPIDEFILYENG